MEKWVEMNLMPWVKEIDLCQTLCEHLGYFPRIILFSWSFKYLMGLQRLLFHVSGQTFRIFIKLWISKCSPGNEEESHNHGVINRKNLLWKWEKCLVKLFWPELCCKILSLCLGKSFAYGLWMKSFWGILH